MMRKPKEITDDEWESLTSPENYYRDGEVSRAQADEIFRRNVARIVASRQSGVSAGTKQPAPRRKRFQPTSAAAVSRVINDARITGLRVVTAPSKRVIVQGAAVTAAARLLSSKGYVFTWNGSSITVSGRNT